jgi:hypothetical protein
MYPHSVSGLLLSAVRILALDFVTFLHLQPTDSLCQISDVLHREEVRTGSVLPHIEVLLDLGALPKPQLCFIITVES